MQNVWKLLSIKLYIWEDLRAFNGCTAMLILYQLRKCFTHLHNINNFKII